MENISKQNISDKYKRTPAEDRAYFSGFPYSKPEYYYFNEVNSIHIHYNNYDSFLVDIEDHLDILNSRKKFVKHDDLHYPYYTSNDKKITIIDFLYKFDYMSTNYEFINGDIDDIRRSNIKIYHDYNDVIREKYPTAEYIQGHYHNLGVDAFLMKNPLWKINENEKNLLWMYCEKNTVCSLCEHSYNKIIEFEKKNLKNEKITWYMCDNGYIAGKVKGKQLYMHEIIFNNYSYGKKTLTVDHIDKNKLNNTIGNLCLITSNVNEKKRMKRGYKNKC
jgi:hypothetical protein